ncbi:MAG: hypothetical protein AB7L66_00060 [Gemmatimonadales bacterium]
MTRIRIPLTAVIAVAGVLLPGLVVHRAVAQETAPLVLRLPATAQLAAVGGAYLGGGGIDAVFMNPAQTPSRGWGIGAARFGSAATQAAFASATAVGRVNVAAFIRYLDYGGNGFPARPGGLTVRGADNQSSIAGGLSAATTVKGVRLGVATQYAEERVPLTRGGVTAVTVGAARDVSRFVVGIAVEHLGSSLNLAGTTADLPTRVSLGANSRRIRLGAFFDVTAGVAVSRERDGSIGPAGTSEIIYEPVTGWTATLRASARRVARNGDPSLQPFTIGAALGLDRFALDYSFEPYRGTGAVHRIGIRIE